jgi:DNA-directed RNA polymerase II subunit RPB2
MAAAAPAMAAAAPAMAAAAPAMAAAAPAMAAAARVPDTSIPPDGDDPTEQVRGEARRAWFRTVGIHDIQLATYEKYMTESLPQILAELIMDYQGADGRRYVFTLENPKYLPPRVQEEDMTVRLVTPSECRLRKLTYANEVVCDVRAETTDGRTGITTAVQHQDVPLFKVPTMVGSRYCNESRHAALAGCPYDRGGYFVVNGAEKVLVSQEKPESNYVFVKRSASATRKYSHACEIRSQNEDRLRSTSTLYINVARTRGWTPPAVIVRVPFLDTEFPVQAIFRIFGVDNKNAMVRYILATSPAADNERYVTFLRCLLHVRTGLRATRKRGSAPAADGTDVPKDIDVDTATVPQMLAWVRDYATKQRDRELERREQAVQNVFTFEFLPHMGTEDTDTVRRRKMLFFGHALDKLLRVYHGLAEPDNRDHWAHLRVVPPGMLMAFLTRQVVRSAWSVVSRTVSKALRAGKRFNIVDRFQYMVAVTNHLFYAIKTGTWGIQRARSQTGVAQLLSRMNMVDTISHFRRINLPLNRDGKFTKPRQLRSSQLGVKCPVETPEGESCGLVANFASSTEVRWGLPIFLPTAYLRSVRGFTPIDACTLDTLAVTPRVFVNGALVGVAADAERAAEFLAECRRAHSLPRHMTVRIVWPDEAKKGVPSLYVNTDAGACVRPLFVLSRVREARRALRRAQRTADARSVLWESLLACGAVEYVHKFEEADLRVAFSMDEVRAELRPLRPRRAHDPDAAHRLWLVEASSVRTSLISADAGERAERLESLGLEPATIPSVQALAEHLMLSPDYVGPDMTRPVTDDEWRALLVERWRAAPDPLFPSEDAYVGHCMRFRYPPSDDPFTHCQLHPTSHLGLTAALAAYANRDQAPRWIYGSAMVKQAMAPYTSNYTERMDTLAHVLWYPNRPIVRTDADDVLNIEPLCHTQNVVVAILCYDGFNMEDSVLLNAGSLQRGLFRASTFRTYMAEERCMGTDSMEIARPPDDAEWLSHANYSLLGEDGLVAPGTPVKPGDIIIGLLLMTSSIADRSQTIVRDHSVPYRGTCPGVVDRVFMTTTPDGTRLAKVRVRIDRPPVVGDKFSSRHAQKGIGGRIVPEIDLPFTAEGIRPDVVLNSHSQPSRMTSGHLTEALAGKLGAITGRIEDGSPFGGRSFEDMSADLKEAGAHPLGNEQMMCGMTGQPLEGLVFLCVMPYTRLKHLAQEKWHSRARGPMARLTRQPIEGRARDGGLRLGEMERDTLITHGAAWNLQDRLLFNSDAFDMVVCERCGLIAQPARGAPGSGGAKDPGAAGAQWQMDRPYCRSCGTHDTVVKTTMPFAAVLMLREVEAMGIAMRLDVTEPEEPEVTCQRRPSVMDMMADALRREPALAI